jgi:uncharacterized protein (TIGR03083 family)
MRPAPPIDVIDLFPDERALLLDLLASLSADEWAAPTVCAPWSVKDLAGHIAGDDLGHLSWQRDAHSAAAGPDSWDELIAFINRQNAQWVEAMRRVSPAVIIEMLRFSGEQFVGHMRALDLMATGPTVDWAGPGPHPMWLHVAREYTERWSHQQQIRDAVNKPGLKDRRFFAPLLDAYARGIPHAFRDVASPEGTHIHIEITGDAGHTWSLVRADGRWALYTGVNTPPDATTTLDQETAWRLFTKGVTPDEARSHATLSGDTSLAAQVLRTVSVLA